MRGRFTSHLMRGRFTSHLVRGRFTSHLVRGRFTSHLVRGRFTSHLVRGRFTRMPEASVDVEVYDDSPSKNLGVLALSHFLSVVLVPPTLMWLYGPLSVAGLVFFSFL
jgi:hypothetical protein